MDEYAERASRSVARCSGSATRSWLAFSSAVVAASVARGSADATILYSGVRNLEPPIIPGNGSPDYSTAQTNIDLDFDGSPDVRIRYVSDYSYGPIAAFSGSGAEALMPSGGTDLLALASGSSVTASGRFSGFAFFGSNYRTHPFQRGTPGIAGFRVGGKLGWIRVELGNDGFDISLEVIDWAIETDPGKVIAAGAIPEPGTGTTPGLGLLALGARGVRQRRAQLGTKGAEAA